MSLCIDDLDWTSANSIDNTVSQEKNPPWVSPLQGLHFFLAYPPLRGGLTSGRASSAGVSSCRRHRAPHE